MASAPALPAAAPARPRLRLLCLHSFRTSGRIFQEQLQRAGLDRELADLVELVGAAAGCRRCCCCRRRRRWRHRLRNEQPAAGNASREGGARRDAPACIAAPLPR